MTVPLIEIRNLQYKAKDRSILYDASLQLEAGSTLGLIGRTGAGKTTLLRCLLGLSFPDAGEVLLFGEPATGLSAANKARIGYAPQSPGLPAGQKVSSVLGLVAGWQPGWNARWAGELLRRFELRPQQSVASLSVGQQQLLGLVMALGHRPELLVLDEPVASLDPVTRRTLASTLAELQAERGCSIIFSTHILSELERLATHIAVIEDGRIGLHCESDDIRQGLRRWQLSRADGDTPGPGWPQHRDIPGLLRYRQIDSHHASLLVDIRKGADPGRLPGVVSEHALNLEDFVVEYLQ